MIPNLWKFNSTRCEMHSQLSNLGNVISNAKFAIIISNALPSMYDILKTLAVSTVSDMSQLASETLVEQVLREEKCKANQDSASTLFAKQGKMPEKSSSSKHPQKSKKGKNRPHCTNPKCKKIGHTIEKCWAEGGGSEGQRPEKTSGSQSRSGQTGKAPKKKDGKTDLLLAQEYAAVAKSDCVHSTEWIIDSGASSHICADRSWFSTYSLLNPPRPIYLGDKRVIHAIGQGQIEIKIHLGIDHRHTIVKDVLHCPQIGMNLLSVTHLTKVGAKVRFTENKCEILNPDDELIGIAHFFNGLFRLPCTIMGIERTYITKHSGEDHGVNAVHVTHMTTASASIDTWHVHLGHISIDSILR